MSSDLSLVSALRETAAQQGVHPTEEDLQGVLDFLTRILPPLEQIEERIPPEIAP